MKKKQRMRCLTVQADVMEGKDDRPVSLGYSLHGAVDSAMRSLHIVLLQTQTKSDKRLPLFRL